MCNVVKAGGYGPRELVIRVNGQDTEWGKADLKAAAHAKPDAILAPKISSGDEIRWLDETLSEAGARALAPALGDDRDAALLLNLKDIAATAKTTRLAGFVMGSNDLLKDFRADPMPGRENLRGRLYAGHRRRARVRPSGVRRRLQRHRQRSRLRG